MYKNTNLIKLSPYHKIFYIEWLLNPDDYRYNMSIDQILYGNLDINRLKKSLIKYVQEHVILNSHIKQINGIPFWECNDNIGELEYSDNDISNDELLSYVCNKFNLLTNGPLYRFKLIKIKNKVFRFILVFHHILVDGASSDKGIFEQISNYYNDKSYTAPYNIDTQVYLIEKLTNELSDKLTNDTPKHQYFWKKLLPEADEIDLKFLKTNNFSDNNKLVHVTQKEIRFSYELNTLKKLNQLKNKYFITPYIYGQCILAILLYRYTNQKAFTICCPVAIKEGINFIYGAQINNTLIFYKINDYTTIIDLFNQTRHFFKSLKQPNINYTYYPITDILQDCNKNLLNVSFVQANFKDKTFNFEGVSKVDVLDILNVDLASPLLFEQELRDNKLNFRVRFNTTLINKELLDNFVSNYYTLFYQILEYSIHADLDKPIYYYFKLEQAQFQKLISDCNRTQQYYLCDKTIHKLFEEQVQRTPNNIALIYDNMKFSYAELNNHANHLALLINKNNNIFSDNLIILLLNKSEYVIISILAVLKSGGAYVPIDPLYPDSRIIHILKDTQPKVILTDIANINRLSALQKNNTYKLQHINDKNIIVVDDNKLTTNILNEQFIANLPSKTSNTNLAYVLYTSGTTGDPKGVMVEHNNLVNFIINFKETIFNNPCDSLNTLSTTNYTFDIFGLEYMLPLLHGYYIELIDLINYNNKITINKYGFIQLTPSKINLLIEKADCSTNSYKIKPTKLLIGGEPLTKSVLSKLDHLKCKLMAKNKSINWEVINVYGPTETTIWSTFNRVKNYNTDIGTPLPNEKLYVLDHKLNPVPIGVIGELYIGGAGVARGYLNKPELTKEKFIPDPFQSNIGQINNKNIIMYNTGDLVRWLPNMHLEYIGRTDSQIKVRGHRVEPGEIENTLSNFPGIKQSVVTASQLNNNTNNLIAYYVSDYPLEESKILNYLNKQLPKHLLPDILVHLYQLPLTVNGKIDRTALPAVKIVNVTKYVKPNNQQEEMICKAFAKVLEIEEKVGINDDFFRCGGNSIQAIMLTTVLQENFNIKVADVFNLRTPAQLAAHITFGQNFIKNKLKQVIIKENNTSYGFNKNIDNSQKIKLDNYLKDATETSYINIYQQKTIINVLLTGSTGYLGCNILNQLLLFTTYNISLIIRANSIENAFNRINKKFQFYFGNELNDLYRSRISIITGDLEQYQLGLSANDYYLLALQIDSIIHAAALVKHYGEYKTFHSANTQATINLLEFASITRLKDFHYISSYSVLNTGYIPNCNYYIYTEDDLPYNLKHWHNSYINTKLQGELQVIKYRTKGIKGNIYRIGNLSFMQENYCMQENIKDNAFFCWLKCLFELKCVTPGVNIVEISPVDLTANAIIKLFDKVQLANNIYHVFNPYLYDISNIIINDHYKLTMVPIKQFINIIIKCLDNNMNQQLIARFLLRQGWLDEHSIQNKTHIEVLQNKTQSILKQFDFDWLSVSHEIISQYFKHVLDYSDYKT